MRNSRSIIVRLRRKLTSVLRGRDKTNGGRDLTGMDLPDLISYLNDNEHGYKYGDKGIQVDHIVPCVAFNRYGDLEDPFYQKMLSHYSNLQLLPASVNASKNDKCDWETFYAYFTEFRALTGLKPM